MLMSAEDAAAVLSDRQAHKRFAGRWLTYTALAWGVLLGSFAYLEHEQFHLRVLHETTELEFQLSEQARIIRHEISDIAKMTRHLAAMHSVLHFLESNDPEHQRFAEASLLSVAAIHPEFVQLRVLDARGKERIRAERFGERIELLPDAKLQDKSKRYYYTEGTRLQYGQVYLSPIDLNIEHGQIEVPHRSVIRTVSRINTADGKLAGMVVINADITRLILDYAATVLDKRADHMMVAPSGVWQLAEDKSLEWGDQLAHEHRFSTAHPAVWQAIRSRDRGAVKTPEGFFGFHTVNLEKMAQPQLVGTMPPTILLIRLPASSLSWMPFGQPWANRSELLAAMLLSALLCLLLAGLRHDNLRKTRAHFQNLERLRLAGVIFDNTSEALVVTDADLHVIAVNRATTELTGYSEAEIIGKRPSLWASGVHDHAFYEALWNKVSRSGQWQGEIVNRRKDGGQFAAWENISAVRDARGETTHYVAIMTDISPLKEAEARLEKLAYHDALTWLPNRVRLYGNLEQLTQISRRQQGHFGVAIMDLDNFKVINDSLGHDAGDELLKVVAERLGHEARSQDTIARLGGDEFALLLPGLKAGPEAEHLIQRMLTKLAEPLVISGREIRPQASCGIALFPDDGDSGADLIKAADAAMYVAKSLRKHSYAFHHPEINRRAQRRMELEQALRHALKHDELRLHYQPQLNLASDRIEAVEALLRWQHPSQGFITAAEFIPIAEESGLINEIGQWVIEQACAQSRIWHRRGLAGLRIAVNLSGHQLGYEEIKTCLFGALQKHGLATSGMSIELEVTESMLMQDAKMIDTLEDFRSHGVTLALDDFGTGFSSLGQLRRLPVSRLKIAGVFVRDMEKDPEDLAIVRTIVRLAKDMNMKVLAEGVETASQRALLEQMGCDEIQGYLIAPALDPTALEEFMQKFDQFPTQAQPAS